MTKPKRILALFAHPDDELGCIGTLKKHAERGDEVLLVWTTEGELASQFVDVPDAEVRRVRQEHGKFVADKIGGTFKFFDMGDSRMTGSRDEGLQIARLYAAFKPDVVIAWSDDNAHPDHRASAKIAYDAVTLARIPKIINEGLDTPLLPHREEIRFYQYTTAAYNWPTLHIDISKQIDTAEELFRFYQSFYGWQFTPAAWRESRAQQGREVGVKYAEKLQLRRRFMPALEYLV